METTETRNSGENEEEEHSSKAKKRKQKKKERSDAGCRGRIEMEKIKEKTEENLQEYLYPVSVKKRSKGELEAVKRSGRRMADPEPQRPHLTFLLMRKEEHNAIHRMYLAKVGEIEETKKIKVVRKESTDAWTKVMGL